MAQRRVAAGDDQKVPVHVAWDGRVYVKAKDLLTNKRVQKRIRELSKVLREDRLRREGPTSSGSAG